MPLSRGEFYSKNYIKLSILHFNQTGGYEIFANMRLYYKDTYEVPIMIVGYLFTSNIIGNETFRKYFITIIILYNKEIKASGRFIRT